MRGGAPRSLWCHALTIPRKGPAHYQLLAQALGVPSRWIAEVDVRISKFDQISAETEFRIR